jgi:hypothetical protein
MSPGRASHLDAMNRRLPPAATNRWSVGESLSHEPAPQGF